MMTLNLSSNSKSINSTLNNLVLKSMNKAEGFKGWFKSMNVSSSVERVKGKVEHVVLRIKVLTKFGWVWIKAKARTVRGAWVKAWAKLLVQTKKLKFA